jgi:hypothetical protein
MAYLSEWASSTSRKSLGLGHDTLYGEGRYQSDEKLLKTIMMKHEVRCSVAGAQMCLQTFSVS